ncbi:DUF3828 domain-containing protein [Bradyrhizobium prioriisuperbiae]|uniref:DUF3828 domain-containing protein n=1 Tax=Bradyrhizobium prioriisuperbiae TaxID=2854389 RepID=UPI0028ED4442|nr:DUF3828 domain-containing protein [Bradyrhizobium prioritasuperba]
MSFDRRAILSGLLIVLAALCTTSVAQSATATDRRDPAAIVTWIYRDAGKPSAPADDAKNIILWDSNRKRMKIFSQSLMAQWAKADKRASGDAVIDFDPVSNSQDPDIKSVAIAAKSSSSNRATIAATLTPTGRRVNATTDVVRCDFVRDGDEWKIDNMRGHAGSQSWAIRDMLAHALRN